MKLAESSPSFRWSNRGRCSTHWRALLLGLKVADGMTVSNQAPEGERRYRVQISDQSFRLRDEIEGGISIQAIRGSRARAKLFGWFPLPAIRTWTFDLPNLEHPFVVVEKWPTVFEIGGLVLSAIELPVRHGTFHTFGHFECHIRPWASVGNIDADFSWEQDEWFLPAAIATAFLQHQMHERTSDQS